MRVADKDVLIVVDVQNDFCTGGALAVPDGEKVVPAINRIADAKGVTVDRAFHADRAASDTAWRKVNGGGGAAQIDQ